MTKKHSINIIVLLSIILILGLLASFLSFTYPFSIDGNYYRYSCFVDELVLGADVDDGVVISYRADLPTDEEAQGNFDIYMDNTIAGLEDILKTAGYSNSQVVRKGDSGIYVTVGNISSDEDRDDVISLIGNPEKLKFSSSSTSTSDSESDILGKYVDDVQVKSQAGNGMTVYYVDIQFDKIGTEKLKTLTTEISNNSGTLYMYLGDTPISQNSLNGPITDGHITMFSEENFVDRQTTQNYANKIKTGLLDLELTQLESSMITPMLGHNVKIFLTIALVVALVASIIFLIVQYRELGVMAMYCLLAFVVLSLGLLQSIPFVSLNMSGILALMIGFVFALNGIITIIERAKREYKSGKKLHTCFKLAQNKSWRPILISNVMLFASSVICAIIPQSAIRSFGFVGIVTSLVSLFISLAMFRLMIKLYSAINFYKGERCNFKLEEDKKNAK